MFFYYEKQLITITNLNRNLLWCLIILAGHKLINKVTKALDVESHNYKSLQLRNFPNVFPCSYGGIKYHLAVFKFCECLIFNFHNFTFMHMNGLLHSSCEAMLTKWNRETPLFYRMITWLNLWSIIIRTFHDFKLPSHNLKLGKS